MDGGSANAIPPLLQRIRSMWEFANLCQWIYIFGKAAKIDDTLEIEDIETECLKTSSTVLSDIALALLKLVSSRRDLTRETLDEQLRKQYVIKLPEENPLGNSATVLRSFCDLDTPTKVTVLQQLTQWIMSQPERLREKMEKADGIDQTSWRIEPYGWDAHDRTYYVLDDNRVYRLTEAPEPFTQKPSSKKTCGTSRRSGRRRHTSHRSITKNCGPTELLDLSSPQASRNLGGMTWECVAVSLDDVRCLIDSFRKTRDANEKILLSQLDVHLLPILEKQEESRKRKEAQHQRELLSLAKMANAKRSSRIAGKIEQYKEEEKARDQRVRAQRQLESQEYEKQNQLKLEQERDFRLFSREKRLKERAARRLLHEEELAQLSEGHNYASDGRVRISDRQLQSEIDRNKQALEALEEEEKDWIFDCVCGLYGQVDDGAHSVACERCSVWQHSSCIGIEESEADLTDFHFVCGSCTRQTGDTGTSRKTVIKSKVKSSQQLMDHPTDGEASQAKSTPTQELADLNTSMPMSEAFTGSAGNHSGTIRSYTSSKPNPGADARPIYDNNGTGRLVLETKPRSVIGTSEAPRNGSQTPNQHSVQNRV